MQKRQSLLAMLFVLGMIGIIGCTNIPTTPSLPAWQRDVEFYTIIELNTLVLPSEKDLREPRNYTTEGYVFAIYPCSCPDGVFCKPCIEGITIVETLVQKGDKKESMRIEFSGNRMRPEDFIVGKKYLFLIEIYKYKSSDGFLIKEIRLRDSVAT